MIDGKFLTFGEILIRLSPPGHELLLQTPALRPWVGGAEANVATALAMLGHAVSFASKVPDNDLGRWVLATLRGHGVDTSRVQIGGERMGLYFATSGAGARAGDVLYDREHSAFAEAPSSSWDWDQLLEGVGCLHLSGISLAIGPQAAEAAITASAAAATRGISVSFDGNWRGKLWARSNADPKSYMDRIMPHVTLLFGNHRDIGLSLGRDFAAEEMGEAAIAAFANYPQLKMIASTDRVIESAGVHLIAGRIDAREGSVETGPVRVESIVDRIGTGDAFAAGILHALATRQDSQAAVETGLALSLLKHSLPGDASLFRQADVEALREGAAIRR